MREGWSRFLSRQPYATTTPPERLECSALDEQDWRAHIEAVSRGDPIRIRNYLDSGYYSHHIRRYLEHFPREQLKVVFSHDLTRDAETTVRDVWRHLGVADDVPLPG